MPTISIISAVKNGENHIERTIRSVLSQELNTDCKIEYIIVDGNSTDGTVEVCKRYANSISKIISESDAGLSDAWNKGTRLASGEFIALINAGDEYYPESIASAIKSLDNGSDIVYGDTDLVDEHGNIERQTVGNFHPWKHGGGIGFYHPSVVARTSTYRDIGGFNTGLRYAMDTDWLLRAVAAGKKMAHGDHRVRMLSDGLSVRYRMRAYGEFLETLERNLPDQPQAVYLSMLSTAVRGLAKGLLRR